MISTNNELEKRRMRAKETKHKVQDQAGNDQRAEAAAGGQVGRELNVSGLEKLEQV